MQAITLVGNVSMKQNPIPQSLSLYFKFPSLSLTMEPMTYFLFKTEPDVYSFDDFLRDKETVWDGVTNPTAVKYLREMKAGTKWIFYHTGDERTAVGTGTVVSVDPARSQGSHRPGEGGQAAEAAEDAGRHQGRAAVCRSPLVIIGRLSVVPLTEEQWEWFLG